MGYSYRWLRGLDYNLMPPEILEKCDPDSAAAAGGRCGH